MRRWLNQIHQGDCLQLMSQMPAGSVGPSGYIPAVQPAEQQRNGMKNGNGGKWSRSALMRGYADHGDCMPHDDYVAWQRECLRGMLRALAPEGAIFYNHKWRVQRGLLQDRSDIMDGFPVRQIIIWQRLRRIQPQPRLLPAHLRGNLPDCQPEVPAGSQGWRHWRCVAHPPGSGQPAPGIVPAGTGSTRYRRHHG